MEEGMGGGANLSTRRYERESHERMDNWDNYCT